MADWENEEVAQRADGFEVVILKDLSQLPDDGAAQLMLRLGAPDAGRRAYLVAANEGKLRNALKSNPLRETVANQLRGEGTPGGAIRVVNLGRATSSSYVVPLLERMTDASMWSDCDACPAAGSCILRHNRDKLSRPDVQGRVKLLYEVIEHQDIRVTLRDTLIHLSHTLTGGLSCADIARKSSQAAPMLHTRAYYQNCWGDGGDTAGSSHESAVAAHLARLPVGEYSLFEVDQFIIYGDFPLGDGAGSAEPHHAVFGNAVDLAGNRFENERRRYLLEGGEGDAGDRFLSEWLNHCRRKVFFEWANTTATNRLLPFSGLPQYFELLNAPTGPQSRAIKRRLVRALNSVFTGLFLQQDETLYIPSGYRDEYLQPDPLIIGKRAEWQLQFEVRMPCEDDLDCELRTLFLTDVPSGEKLELDLITFEYLRRVGGGGSLRVLAEECILKLRDFQDRLLRTASKNHMDSGPIEFLAYKDHRHQVVELDPDVFSAI